MKVDLVMPKMGESLQEGTIIKWLKNEGDRVERDEMILEISTDKVDTEIPSPNAGILSKIMAEENETVEVGKVIAVIETEETEQQTGDGPPTPSSQPKVEEKPKPEKATEEPKLEAETIPRLKEGKFYSPLVRNIAEKENVNITELESISGSGVDGRVTKKDILSYIEKRKSKSAINSKSEIIPKPPSELTSVPKREIALGHDTEVIPMNRVRQLIAEHMVYSKRTSAHVTSVAEADVTGLVKLRNAEKAAFLAREGFKLTYTPFFSKAIVDGVRQFPMVNVSVDDKNIIRHIRINLGIATALDNGNLIVPVIRNADDLGLTGLARQIYDLSTKARSRKLNPDDIQGGTITLTNVGTFGTLFGTPIINQPQTAIIGVGAIKKRPVVKEVDGEDHIVIRQMMYVSITYDHRVIDGMLAGQTLAAIVKGMEGMSRETVKF
ncbi:dihydrolipoamide acetyltransferase family protein [Bacteroidota bacterium]